MLDPLSVTDVFVTDLVGVERIAGCLRLTLAQATAHDPSLDGPAAVIVERIVIPAELAGAIALALLGAEAGGLQLGGEAEAAERGEVQH